MPVRRVITFLVFGALVLLASVYFNPAFRIIAAPPAQQTPEATPQVSPTPEPLATSTQPPTGKLSIADEVCLDCHGQPGQNMTLQNGDTLELYVPAEMHQGSIHGKRGYACVQCHTTVGEYPHPKFTATDRRNVTEQINEACARCHRQQNDFSKDSAHQAARARGVREAALCVDCHTAHEVRPLTDPQTGLLMKEAKTWIPERCALCHNAIYQKYRASVHGAALRDGNPDVPTCIDCHGVHNIADPRTAAFRLQSPQICAKCHTDPALMVKYGLPTDVLNTYVADFHGQTVAIFEKQAPDAQVNKPVCYDCHGVHDIGRVDDPKSGLDMQQNLLTRCKVCHPDASASFPSAWMSHYIPSPEHYALVYYVNLFYKFFIPGTLGGMALLVVMDASRTWINRSRRRRAHPPTAPEVEHVAMSEQPAPAGDDALTLAPEHQRSEIEATVPAGEANLVQTDIPAIPDVQIQPPDPDQPAAQPEQVEPDSSASEVEHG